jgi:hypothetical protein
MKSLLLFIFLSLSVIVNAQKLTQQQAITYAEKLYEVEILSEKGKNTLLKQIEKSEMMRTGRPNLQDGSIEVLTDSSVPGILNFCAESFMNEFYYRSGLYEQQFIFKKLEKKGKEFPLTEEEQLKLYKKHESRFKKFEGYQIEERIIAEDTFSTEGGWVVYPPFSSMNREYGLIHHEGQVVGYAAQRVTYYEDYKINYAKEIAFLQNLVEKEVMSQENYRRLVASYQPYELKEKFDFLPYCKQSLVFELSAYSLEPEVYYANIFAEIRKIIPDFNYENLEIKINSEDDSNPEFLKQTANISFEVNGRKYLNIFFHDYVRKVPQPDDITDTLPKISTDFHKGINKRCG